MKSYQIAVIPGDGIGLEVVPATVKVLDKVAALAGFKLEYTNFDYSCEYYVKNGQMMSDDGLERLRDFDDIYLGAVGYPGVADHVSLWGLLIPIRRTFEQYINIRPVRLLRGLESPLKNIGPNDIDFVIVRENNEGEYSEIGGRLYAGTERKLSLPVVVLIVLCAMLLSLQGIIEAIMLHLLQNLMASFTPCHFGMSVLLQLRLSIQM